jgi:hypothetical protein
MITQVRRQKQAFMSSLELFSVYKLLIFWMLNDRLSVDRALARDTIARIQFPFEIRRLLVQGVSVVIPPLADAVQLFSDYLKVTGVAHIAPEPDGDPALIGKRLGLLNGSSWITLWSNYFGRLFLPGVHLVNMGNEAIQMNFMQAHRDGQPTPPPSNIRAFVRYARDLVTFGRVDAVLITCSTMNRAYSRVRGALEPLGVPVAQIDRPTVASTQALLRETAHDMNRPIAFSGITVEDAWERLAAGDVSGHNHALDQAIRAAMRAEPLDSVVLAQLSMTVFLLSHPDPEAEYGIPVFASGQCGFEHMRELLASGAQ